MVPSGKIGLDCAPLALDWALPPDNCVGLLPFGDSPQALRLGGRLKIQRFSGFVVVELAALGP
jgi:hypothetical protein